MTITDDAPVTDQDYRDRATALANMLMERPERHNQRYFTDSAPDNECGTTACIAGWAGYAAHGYVDIDLDGTMTWDRAAGPVRSQYIQSEEAIDWERVGREWLGLTWQAGLALFYTYDEKVAVEVLRRVGDGRWSRNFTADDIGALRFGLNGD
jgi:hypothetical protein